MIRSSFWKSVYFSLESHPFLEVEDFAVTEYRPNGHPHLKISCICCPQWSFDLRVPQQAKGAYPHYEFAYSMSPGRYAEGENGVAKGADALISEIKEWMKRLHEDILAAPTIRRFQAYSAGLEKHMERLGQVPDEFLSRKELSEFEEALDHIKDDIINELTHLISNTCDLTQRTNEVSHQVQFLKQSLGSLTKRQWGRAFFVRLCKWRYTLNLKQLAVGTQMLENLLAPGESEGLAILYDFAESVAQEPDKKSHRKDFISLLGSVSREPNLQ